MTVHSGALRREPTRVEFGRLQNVRNLDRVNQRGNARRVYFAKLINQAQNISELCGQFREFILGNGESC